MIDRTLRTRLFWLLAFGAAFGYVEGAVVVYLREIYYPEGFRFPLTVSDGRLLAVEVGREAATLVMLLGTAMLAGRNRWERFGAFAFLFGVWDLVYYVLLYTALGWPESLLTWDILFLLPFIWAGPVLSAVLVAASLVVSGALIYGRGDLPRPDRRAWAGAAASIALLLAAFMSNHGVVQAGGVPDSFPWLLYGVGMALGWDSFRRALYPGRTWLGRPGRLG
jgi:hypothetical protein